MRDEGAVASRHNGGQTEGFEVKRGRGQGAGAARPGRTKRQAPQPFVGKQTAKRAGHSRHNARLSEDKGDVPEVRNSILKHGERERQFAGARMLVPAMAAAQAFRSGAR